MIYVPEDTTYDKCYVVQNEDVIRGYDRIPINNTNYYYRDYYIHSDYMFRDGSGTWNNYSTLPVCLSSNDITNDYYYRVDFSNILVIFLILSIFIIYIPYKIWSRLFGRWLKL